MQFPVETNFGATTYVCISMNLDPQIQPGGDSSTTSLLPLFETLVKARHIDLLERRYAARGQAHFHVSGFGHAASAALAPHLNPPDFLHLHYRDKALMLARGLTPLDFFLALFCKRESHSHGRQMSAHMASRKHHILSIVGSVGNNALQAAGIAAAIKMNPEKPIAVCSFGDGTSQQGEVLEAIAEAARSKLPVLFLVHDNQYAISTLTRGKTFFSLADGLTPKEFLGVPIHRLDGARVAECLERFEPIVSEIRRSRSPAIVVLEVERLDDHSNADDQSIYRTPDAIAIARETADPLDLLRRQLLDSNVPETELAGIETRAHADVESAAEQALDAADPEPCSVAFTEPDVTQKSATASHTAESRHLTMLESLRETLRHRLTTDARVVLHGQDIEDPKGDVFGLTRGLSTEFPERVLNAPLSESTIVGSAIGRALAGQRPVALLQFADFLPLAFNQVAAELATMDWRTGGAWKCPVIIMAICGGYKAGLGPFHAQTMEGFATHIPGLDVVMPGNAADAAGLLEAAFQGDRPTLFLYPKSCVNDRTLAGDVVIGRSLQPGKAAVLRKGTDLTMVAWGATVPFCTKAAEELAGYGAEIELIDLRTLAPWDFDTISRSVQKTNRLVVVHEDTMTGGFGAEIIARLAENGQHPAVRRVTRPDTYIPCNFENQLEILPTTERIVAEAAAMMEITLSQKAEPSQGDDPNLFTVSAFGLSPSDDQISIIQWHVAPGDSVQAGDILADIEADKSSGELDSPVPGVVEKLVQAKGSSVAVGQPLLVIRTLKPVPQQHRSVPPPTAVPRQQAPGGSDQAARPSGDDTAGIVVGPIVVVTGQSALTNAELAERFDTTPDEIFRKIGIESRPRVPPNTSPADLAWKAVAPLLDSPDFDPAALSIIIASTSTVEQVCPSIACVVLGHLQRYRPEIGAPAFDILATCTGWLYALQLAHDHLQQPQARHGTALVITTEMLSPLVAPEDFGSCISFGDASTATLVFGPEAEHAPSPGVAPIALRRPVISALGDLNRELTVPPMGTGSTIHMNGRAVRQHTVPAMARALRQAASEAGLTPADLAAVLAHQSNQRILTDLAAALDLPADALPSNMRMLGNTSSCTLPLLLNDQRAHNTLAAGTHIGFTAFGGGYTFGAAVGKVL